MRILREEQACPARPCRYWLALMLWRRSKLIAAVPSGSRCRPVNRRHATVAERAGRGVRVGVADQERGLKEDGAGVPERGHAADVREEHARDHRLYSEEQRGPEQRRGREKARHAGAPVVGIGGILTPAQVAQVAACGVDGVCLVRGLGHNPADALPAYAAALERGREEAQTSATPAHSGLHPSLL